MHIPAFVKLLPIRIGLIIPGVMAISGRSNDNSHSEQSGSRTRV